MQKKQERAKKSQKFLSQYTVVMSLKDLLTKLILLMKMHQQPCPPPHGLSYPESKVNKMLLLIHQLLLVIISSTTTKQ